MRIPVIFILLIPALVCVVSPLYAQDDSITGAEVFSGLAKQPKSTRPPLFQSSERRTRCQLAIVIDGTTSMKRELTELGNHLPAVAKVFGPEKTANFSVAVVIYRDSRAPSGSVVVVSDFTNDLKALAKKLKDQKPETGEPYFPEALDQGLQAALESLAWDDKPKTDHRLVLIGDAPPYADDHENRKHHDAELAELADKRKVRIDALLVNSGFPKEDDGVVGTSRETATKAAPYAREFLSMITSKTGGTFLDLWDADQLNSLKEPAVNVGKLTPLPKPDSGPTVTIDAWLKALTHQFASVRAERPVFRALQKWTALKPQSASNPERFPTVWSQDEVNAVIADLNEGLEEEPINAAICLLLINAHSLSAIADAYEDHSQAIAELVTKAHDSKSDTLPAAMRDEIDALYELYVAGDRDKALAGFSKLNSASANAANPGCQLRAAWVCLALESGFWPIASDNSGISVDRERCRKLIHQILKQSADSVEGQALRKLIDDAGEDDVELPKSLFVAPRAN